MDTAKHLEELSFSVQLTLGDKFLKQSSVEVQRDASRGAWQSLYKYATVGEVIRSETHTWDYAYWEELPWKQRLLRRLTPKFLRPVTITCYNVYADIAPEEIK